MAQDVVQKDTAKGPLRGKFRCAGWYNTYLARLPALF
jgi:hypothetical protein